MEELKPVHKLELRQTTLTIIIIIFLIGSLLIAISILLEHLFWKTFTKELAVVILTIGGVSMLYEIFIAEKHFHQFIKLLSYQIERGERNAAVCEQLGIREIFPRRDLYEAKYPLKDKAASAVPGSNYRIVARTLHLLINKPESIKMILTKGGNIQLCFYDPDADPTILKALAELEDDEILFAFKTFRRYYVDWLQDYKPPGSLEVRCHKVHLLESYFSYTLYDKHLAAWDLSFGRDVTSKRIFLLNIEKGLGLELCTRYEKIWEISETKFKYENNEIVKDELVK